MTINYTPIPTNKVEQLRKNGLDAHHQTPKKAISDGSGIPCRHCLEDITTGDAYLTLAYCPFDEKNAYAEIGPIFIHAKTCQAYATQNKIPPSFLSRQYYMLRAYDKTTKAIIEGSGQRIETENISKVAKQLLDNDTVDFIHLRSATNTCFACKITRA